MTPEQALNILDQYLSGVAVNRASHNQIMTALGVLNTMVVKDKMAKKEKAAAAEEKPQQ